ncbi:helix-turn-helix transcriptional regulator [Ruegeria sediminis]|uniref:Helix-turn-helix transcriptional regulator n=1 Tax=Ruegeria sediminis TaxID=2583820 RepID=A0ABY2X447_9RHOB|nr:helix-turn-helix transcriptional regulator [Ruegeria sediminis]TMV09848.1 helix-turn-helix transcriptional regulator [Ruegeria sediminis]
MSGPVEKARACWGDKLPDWVEGLAAACAESSQNKVAARLGVSAAMISNVIAARYPGDLARLEDLYRGAYEAKVVDCPAMGQMPLDVCHDWRGKAKKLQPANALNVAMFRACNRCALNKGPIGGDGDASSET